MTILDRSGSRIVSIDFIDDPNRGDNYTESGELCSMAPKNGTTTCHRYGTASVASNGKSVTLALTVVRSDEDGVDAVQDALNRVEAYPFEIDLLLADRGFSNGGGIRQSLLVFSKQEMIRIMKIEQTQPRLERIDRTVMILDAPGRLMTAWAFRRKVITALATYQWCGPSRGVDNCKVRINCTLARLGDRRNGDQVMWSHVMQLFLPKALAGADDTEYKDQHDSERYAQLRDNADIPDNVGYQTKQAIPGDRVDRVCPGNLWITRAYLDQFRAMIIRT